MSESERSIDRLQDRIVSHGIASPNRSRAADARAIHWLFLETYNGGLDQFFFNDVGQFAQPALNGLEAVGAPENSRHHPTRHRDLPELPGPGQPG